MKARLLISCAVLCTGFGFSGLGESLAGDLRVQYARSRLAFEANIGQADPAFEYLAHGQRGNVFLGRGSAWLTMQQPTNAGQEKPPQILWLRFSGANPSPKAEALEALPGKANYFRGKDSRSWHTDASTFARVKYTDVYPGVDLVYYGNQERLEYDLVVQPGADPRRIALEFSRADRLEVGPDGDLLIHVGAEVVCQRKPVVYQELAGVRKAVAGGYVLRSATEVGFELAEYDRGRPLAGC